jgi:putative aldouronate transport system substrate-binding protein
VPQSNTLPFAKTPITVKWYQNNLGGAELKSMAETAGFQELQKRTGINIDWQHPANPEQFNMMLASGDLPDLMFWNWAGIPRGLEGLVNDGTVIKLNDLIDKYAPNYKRLLAQYPESKKWITLDDGTIATFGQIEPDPRRTAYTGLLMRKDWLDKIGLKQPTTIDEWYTTLKAFKEKDPNGNGKADEIPYTVVKTNSGSALGGSGTGLSEFAAAWGILDGFYKDPTSGKLLYGPVQPAYKDYLSTMNKWYKEGLIDSEFAATDAKKRDANLQSDISGATFGLIGGTLGNNTKAARAKNPNFSLIGIAPPSGPAGKPYNSASDLLMKGTQGVAITKNAKNAKEIVQMLDYLYSDDGAALYNWGIEGKSYTVKDGKKQFVDAILNNPDGKSPANALAHYAFATQGANKMFDYEAYSQINLGLPEQKLAAETWSKGDVSLNTPTTLGLSSEESAKLASIMNDITTYKNEMFLKFIMGVEPMDKYDGFVKRLKDMGIEEANKIYQDAFNRFNTRK